MSLGNGTSSENLTLLRREIGSSFNLDEFRNLTADLDVDYDNLRGEIKDAKIQAFLEHLAKRGRISSLIDHLKRHRPTQNWDAYLAAQPEAHSPYKGLQPFREEDQHLFFGRERITTELLDHLRQHRFLAVVGASGSGKSSVVRAGLIPAVQQGKIEESRPSAGGWPASHDWRVLTITPGDEPLKALANILTQDSESVTAMKTLTADLRADPESLDLFLFRQMADRPNGQTLLVVDQFEELFTQCDDLEARRLFVENLVTAVSSGKQGRLALIITLRADFYTFAVQYESLRPLLETRQKIVGQMNQEELREAIEKPARENGWQFQGGLVETVLQDVSGEPGSLPLLSHALQETWNRREGRLLTLAGYQGSGGVRGAIAKTADAVYTNLPPDQQTLARTIFLRLTELGEGTEDTRRRVVQSELVRNSDEQETITTLLQKLADARLITTDTLRQQDSEPQEVVEVSHEALIREWPTLRTWLDENREWLRLHRRLTQDTKEWLAANKDTSLLYRGGKLAQMQEQTAGHQDDLNQKEQAFLEAAVNEEKHRAAEKKVQQQRELQAAQELAAARQNELAAQKRRTTVVRRAVAGLSLLLLVAIIASIIAYRESQDAIDAARDAQNSEVIAIQAAVTAGYAQQTAQAGATRSDLSLATAQAAQKTAVSEAIRADQNAATAVFNEQLVATKAAEAIEQAAIVQSQSLAIASQSEFDPNLALLLAVEAARSAKITMAYEALTEQIPQTAARPIRSHYLQDGASAGVWSQNKGQILIRHQDNTARLWDTTNGDLLLTLIHSGPVDGLVWNNDESKIMTWSRFGNVKIWDAVDGDLLLSISNSNDGWFVGAAWNESNTRIATWNSEGVVKIWDENSDQLLLTLAHEPDWAISEGTSVVGLTWNNDESRILSWSESGTAIIWDTVTGDALQTLNHDSYVLDAYWNITEDRILTLSWNEVVRDWDALSGELLTTLPGESWVTGELWNHDKSRLLTWGPADVQVRDGTNGDLLLTLPHELEFINVGESSPILGASWSNDASKILTWTVRGQAVVWDSNSGDQLLALLSNGSVNSASWNHDESLILTNSSKGTSQVWDANTGDLLRTIIYGVGDAVWKNDDNHILTWSADGVLKEWDGTGEYLLFQTLLEDAGAGGARWNRDESRLLAWSNDNTATVWDSTGGGPPLTLPHEAAIREAVWNTDESRIMTWSEDNTVRIWDAADGDLLLALPHETAVQEAAWNDDSGRILTWTSDNTIRVWDAAGGELLLTSLQESTDRGAIFNSDGSRILTWGEDAEIRILDGSSSSLLLTLDHGGSVLGALWNHDDSRILTWSTANTAVIWNAIQGERLLTFPHDNLILGAAWNHDESRLLTWSYDGQAKVWDTASGALLFAPLTHDLDLNGAAWNRDGNHILTWSEDYTAKVWNADDGALLHTLDHEFDRVRGAAWNHDETLILTTGASGLRVWSAETGQFLYTLYLDPSNSPVTAQWSKESNQILMVTLNVLTNGVVYIFNDLLDAACQVTSRNFTWEEWQLYFPGQEYERTCEQWLVHPSVPEGTG